jgi:hypothetical protein
MTTVVFPKDELKYAVDAVVTALNEERKTTLEILGTQLLSLEHLSSQKYAASRTDEDRATRTPNTVATVLARLRKAGHVRGRSIKDLRAAKQLPASVPVSRKQRRIHVVERTVKQNAALFTHLASAGVEFHSARGKKITGANQHKRGTFISANLQSMRHRISSSANGNQPDENSIAVSNVQPLSQVFDSRPPSSPVSPTEAWQKELHELAVDHCEKSVQNVINSRRVS